MTDWNAEALSLFVKIDTQFCPDAPCRDTCGYTNEPCKHDIAVLATALTDAEKRGREVERGHNKRLAHCLRRIERAIDQQPVSGPYKPNASAIYSPQNAWRGWFNKMFLPAVNALNMEIQFPTTPSDEEKP